MQPDSSLRDHSPTADPDVTFVVAAGNGVRLEPIKQDDTMFLTVSSITCKTRCSEVQRHET